MALHLTRACSPSTTDTVGIGSILGGMSTSTYNSNVQDDISLVFSIQNTDVQFLSKKLHKIKNIWLLVRVS